MLNVIEKKSKKVTTHLGKITRSDGKLILYFPKEFAGKRYQCEVNLAEQKLILRESHSGVLVSENPTSSKYSLLSLGSNHTGLPKDGLKSKQLSATIDEVGGSVYVKLPYFHMEYITQNRNSKKETSKQFDDFREVITLCNELAKKWGAELHLNDGVLSATVEI